MQGVGWAPTEIEPMIKVDGLDDVWDGSLTLNSLPDDPWCSDSSGLVGIPGVEVSIPGHDAIWDLAKLNVGLVWGVWAI